MSTRAKTPSTIAQSRRPKGALRSAGRNEVSNDDICLQHALHQREVKAWHRCKQEVGRAGFELRNGLQILINMRCIQTSKERR